MTTYTTTDVLICGAGVTGLTLAIELARHGVSFRLIEKRTMPFTGSRGKGIVFSRERKKSSRILGYSIKWSPPAGSIPDYEPTVMTEAM